MTIQITPENFEDEVLKSPIPVVVDFYGPYCGQCKMIAPVMDQVAAEVEGRAKVAKADVGVEAIKAIAIRYKVGALPTLLFFRNGEETGRITGGTTKANIMKNLLG